MSKHILIIDDEETIRDAFELALDRTAYTVETAASGQEGVDKAAQRRPDLVFLDLKMPGMDGIETLHRLQSRYPDLPVYIVTAFYQEFMEPLKKAAKDGLMFQVAQKPLKGDEIRTIARGVLEGAQRY